MSAQVSEATSSLAGHGTGQLTAVHIDTYNTELRDEGGFVGDRASGRAFRAILEDFREKVRQEGGDPVGPEPSKNIKKRKLDRLLVNGDPEAAGVVIGAVEEFA